MDTLISMRLFAAAVGSGSLSGAGRAFGLAPSSVSRQLAALERDVGARLFNRGARGLTLTEAGEVYARLTQAILEAADQARQQMDLLARHPRGVLRLHAPRAFGRLHVAPAVADFLRCYPDLHVDLTLDDEMEEVVLSGGDLFIRIGTPRPSSLIARRLTGNRRLLCASPAYLRARGTPERPQDLTGHACLTYRFPSGGSIWKLRRKGVVEKVEVDGPLRANDGEALHVAALRGSGIIMQPSWLLSDDLRRGTLVRVLPEYEATATTFDTAVYGVYPSRSLLPPKVRALLDFLAAHLAPLDGEEPGAAVTRPATAGGASARGRARRPPAG